MTLFEVGVVIAIVVILVMLLLPMLANAKRRTGRNNCNNHLRQIYLGFRIWEGDNGDKYPMEISVTLGGAREMVATGNVTQVFQVMSNELGTTKILVCPQDAARMQATNFAGLSNSNISYFVGVDVTNELPAQVILSGDSNLEIGWATLKPGLHSFGTNDPIAWTSARHGFKSGYLVLADGGVQSGSSPALRHYLEQTGRATNRFALP